MPNLFHQSIEDILKTASVEQRLIWNQIFLMLGEKAPVIQYCKNFISTGSEFLSYSASKLYFAYELNLIMITPAPTTTNNTINIMDETNTQRFSLYGCQNPVWDATAAAVRYTPQLITINNIWFSRFVVSTPMFVYFKGFKIGS